MSEIGFAANLERHGHRIALLEEGGCEISYADLAKAADAFANALPVQPQLIQIEARNDMATIVALLGAFRYGHKVLLTSPGSTADSLADLYRPSVRYRSGSLWLAKSEPPGMHPQLALLLSTSGTTGATKCVRISAAALQANAQSISEYLHIDSQEKTITTLPPHYSYGLSVLTTHLRCGATIVLSDASVVDARFRNLFEQHNITSLAGVPHTYETLERVGFREWAPHSLKTLTQAGGRLSEETKERFRIWCETRGAKFYVMYGQTEATARIAYVPPEDLKNNLAAIGTAIPSGSLHLIDPRTKVVIEDDREGELIYSGPNVMLGYAYDASDLGRGRDIEQLATGDLAVRQPNGLFRLTGRKSRFVKPFGLRVSLDEIETQLRRVGVNAAVAGNDEAIVVCYDGEAEIPALGHDLSSNLRLPETLFICQHLPEIPKLQSGKTDYRSILELGKSKINRAAPRVSLLEIFSAAFPNRQPHKGDSFVSLSGDSLNYVLVAAELERHLGFIPAGWEHWSIADLENCETAPRRKTFLQGMDSEILLRALAIIAVVVAHASDWVVGGGAEALLVLAGFNMARFQRDRFVSGRFWIALVKLSKQLLGPYFLVLGLVSILKSEFDWRSWILISNFEGRFGSVVEPFWFIEALLQILVLMAILSTVRPIRRLAESDPLSFGVTLLVMGFTIKFAALWGFQHGHLANRTPDQLFFLFALGWCLFCARTGWAKAAILVFSLMFCALQAGLISALEFGRIESWHRGLWVLGTTILLLFVPRVPIPTYLKKAFVSISAASFLIYITHVIPVHILKYRLEIDLPLLVIAVSLVVGMITHFSAVQVKKRWYKRGAEDRDEVMRPS